MNVHLDMNPIRLVFYVSFIYSRTIIPTATQLAIYTLYLTLANPITLLKLIMSPC